MSTQKNSLTKHDWLDHALQELAHGGLKALAVEPLAKKLHVTKGSFYWHFKNRAQLIAQLLEFWENTELQYQQKIVSLALPVDERMAFLLKLLIEDNTNKYVFLGLSTELSNDVVKAYYVRAIDRRVSMLTSMCRELGLNKTEADNKAKLIYCLYLGTIKTMVDNIDDIEGVTKLVIDFAISV